MVKTTEISIRNFARGALRAFLEDTKNLNWLLGMIRSSGVRGTRLVEIFENLRDYGNRQRYEEAVVACRR
jgi:hypothetical protein